MQLKTAATLYRGGFIKRQGLLADTENHPIVFVGIEQRWLAIDLGHGGAGLYHTGGQVIKLQQNRSRRLGADNSAATYRQQGRQQSRPSTDTQKSFHESSYSDKNLTLESSMPSQTP